MNLEKKYIPNIFLWLIVFWSAPIVFGALGREIYQIVFDDILVLEDLIIVLSMFALYSIALIAWKKINFTKSDYLSLVKKYKIKNISISRKKKGIEFGLYSFVTGYIEDIFCVAMLDNPWFVVRGPTASKKGKTFELDEYPKEFSDLANTSNITFFLPIQTNFSGTSHMEIDVTKRDISNSGLNEIDEIIIDQLKDINDFKAEIIISEKYISMKVYGGSFMGNKFRERIVVGIDLMKKVSNELRNNNPFDWNDFNVIWDKNSRGFKVEEKSIKD